MEYTNGQRVEFRNIESEWEPGVVIGPDYMPDGQPLYATYVVTDRACDYHSRVDDDIREPRTERIERAIEDYAELTGRDPRGANHDFTAALFAILEAGV